MRTVLVLALAGLSSLIAMAGPAAPTDGQFIYRLPSSPATSSACADAVTAGTILYAKATGTGTADGSSWTNALTLPNNSSFVRGKVYCLADGAYGSKTFSTTASGTTTITLAKATVADHGTDTGWSDTMGDGQAVFGTGITFLTSYWVLDGSARTTATSGHGFKIDNSAGSSSELVQFGQFGVPIVSVDLSYVEVEGRGYGQSVVFDRGLYSNSPGTTDIACHYCFLHDMYVPILTRNLQRVTIEYSWIEDNQSRPESHGEPWSDTGTDDVHFRYNFVRNPEGTAVFFFGNGNGGPPVNDHSSNDNTNTDFRIYGNVFFYQNYVTASGNDAGTAGLIEGVCGGADCNYADRLLVYNNTLYDFSHGTASARIDIQITGAEGLTEGLVRNNLFDSCADGATHSGVDADYNYYRNTTHTAETNEQIGVGSLLTNPSAAIFTLTGATTAGASLSSPYNADLTGATRGADGTWDRGAYEYVSSAPEPEFVAQGANLGGILTRPILGLFQGVRHVPFVPRVSILSVSRQRLRAGGY